LDWRHLGGTIICAIQFCKAWTAFFVSEVMFQMTNDPLGAWDELSHFSVFLHLELKCLNCSLDRRHLGGAIISTIQFYKAWTAFIASEVMFQMTNDPLGAWDELSHAFRCFSTANSNISTDLWIEAI
jgi:hypothetical protein